MNIKEMEENGTIDYYLTLKKYIEKFVDKNHPLSQEDLRSILKNDPTDNVIQRQEVHKILNDAMEDALTDVANRNAQIINGANEGKYTDFSPQETKQEIFQIEQYMLERLWKAQHPEEQTLEQNQALEQEQVPEQNQAPEQEQVPEQAPEQNQAPEKDQTQEHEQTGEELVKEVVEVSEESGIRAGEINQVNIEIKQVERDYRQVQLQQQDMGISIGE